MAYQRSNNWWLNGPPQARRGCGHGLGQAAGTPGVCADGTSTAQVVLLGSCADGSLPVCASGDVWAGYCTPPSTTVADGNLCTVASFPFIGTSTAGACVPLSGAGLLTAVGIAFFAIAFIVGGKK